MGDMRSGAASAGSSNKWAILLTVLIMTFMATLDSSIVNVALPVMQKALGADSTKSSGFRRCTC